MTGYIGDGVPESGQYRMAPDGTVMTGPGDNSMLVIFYKRQIPHAVLSAQHGRPFYVDVDYVRIQQPGETTQVVDRPVTENDKRRWPAHWHNFVQNKDQVCEGTPLGLLFPRHPAAIANLQAIGFMTVEHLANASATAIVAIGPSGQDYVNYAQKFLKEAAGGAKFHQMQYELEQEKRKVARMEKQMEEQAHQMAQMNAMIMANAGVGMSPMPGIPRNPVPPPAQPMPGGAMPPAPSFAGSVFAKDEHFDAQAEQINANHPMGPTAHMLEQQQKKRGWPKGKLRGPRTSKDDEAA